MKLCFIASDSIHAVKWIRFFAERGHDILWLATCDQQDVPEIPGVQLYCLGHLRVNDWWIFLRKTLQVRSLLSSWKPDLVHAHYAGINGLLGALSGRRPFVVTAWGSEVLLSLGFTRLLVKFILRRADLLTCDAEHMSQAMIAMGADSQKVHKIMFGIDSELFRPPSPSLPLGPRTAPVIVSLRTLEPLYDIPTFIRAAPLTLKAVPDARFKIVGSGFLEAELRALVNELGMQDCVSFLGRIPNNELPELLRSCDVYVSTSLSDAGIASSTAEAMSCGLPVVVSDSGENRLWVKDGVNGFVIPVSNPEELAKKLVVLLGDRDMRIRMGQANREEIKLRNDYFGEMSKMEHLYLALGRVER